MMNDHSYNLRSRVNSPASLRTPNTTPVTKHALRSPRKQFPTSSAIQLDHVVGTTTNNASGLASCTANHTFAYCAGSTAVLARVDTDTNKITRRYYRAKPTAIPLNPTLSYYDTPTSTPTKKKSSLLTPRGDRDAPITPTRPFADDEGSKTWTARERIKSVTCVALSKNGSMLAVGETGYNPRVLLYSTASDAPVDLPISIVTEHTWGVRSVAFSPDNRYLATLGDANDGFLFVWHIAPKSGTLRLCATNKCTTNVCHMAWCGQRLVTVGTRHIKVWHLPDADKPSPSKRPRIRNTGEATAYAGVVPLSGRNCLLGDLVDATFTCVVPIDEGRILVCADTGQLCTAELDKSSSEIQPLDAGCTHAGVIGFREGPQRLVWAGGGQLQDVALQECLKGERSTDDHPGADPVSHEAVSRTPRMSLLRQSLGLSQRRSSGTTALACLTKHTICIDADANLTLTQNDAADLSLKSNDLSSHPEAVQGVQVLNPSVGLGKFFTWSKSGEIRFWDNDACLMRKELIELDEQSNAEESCSNELRIVRCLKQNLFVSGDRFGVLKIHFAGQWNVQNTVRAHSAEVNDIRVDEVSSLVATCSRDRMVQVFQLKDDNLHLIQTLDEHIAAVNQVLFSKDGETLLSCSSDRTIVVREKAACHTQGQDLVAFIQSRVITIKASPLAMCLMPGQNDFVFLTTLDKFVSKIEISTGTILESFKANDPETDESAALNTIHASVLPESSLHRPLLIGYCASDKSVRAYDMEKHTLVGKEPAHTEGISDLAIYEGQDGEEFGRRFIISTGQDSTIMKWSVKTVVQLLPTPGAELSEEQASLLEKDSTPAKATPSSLPPLRKVLTKVEISEFSRNIRSPSRDPSPARLKRKPSRLTLATSAIVEAEESISPGSLPRRTSEHGTSQFAKRSPSPQRASTMKLRRHRSRAEMGKDFFTRQTEWLRRSPSPVRQEQKANKSRLRRPPSVPVDLRGHAQAQARRSSVLVPNNDTMPTTVSKESTCRMLKAYRRKLQNSTEATELDDIEIELESTLKLVQQKKANRASGTLSKRPSRRQLTRKDSAVSTGSLSETGSGSGSGGSIGRSKGKTLDVNGLSVLLEKTSIASA